MRSIYPTLFAAAALLAGVAGCDQPEPKSPSVGLTEPIHPPQPPDLGRRPPTVMETIMLSMYINEDVRHVCQGPDPFFKFAASKPTDRDRATMRVLADCMTVGPLQGKSIVLVGRTDPRGTEEYNERLGLERAEKVKSYLVANGVDDKRVQTASLGKTDASPFPADWPGDRRVEVRLAPPAVTPPAPPNP
jgi:outer membrane protein OmpA-like peptidoglycan-associated protein